MSSNTPQRASVSSNRSSQSQNNVPQRTRSRDRNNNHGGANNSKPKRTGSSGNNQRGGSQRQGQQRGPGPAIQSGGAVFAVGRPVSEAELEAHNSASASNHRAGPNLSLNTGDAGADFDPRDSRNSRTSNTNRVTPSSPTPVGNQVSVEIMRTAYASKESVEDAFVGNFLSKNLACLLVLAGGIGALICFLVIKGLDDGDEDDDASNKGNAGVNVVSGTGSIGSSSSTGSSSDGSIDGTVRYANPSTASRSSSVNNEPSVISSGSASASSAANTTPLPLSQAKDIITTAIGSGAPVYNQGDHCGCARIYAEARDKILRPSSTTGAIEVSEKVYRRFERVKDELPEGSQESGSSGVCSDAAWALRGAFDEILGYGSDVENEKVIVTPAGVPGVSVSVVSTTTDAPAAAVILSNNPSPPAAAPPAPAPSPVTAAPTPSASPPSPGPALSLSQIQTLADNAVAVGAPAYNRGDIKGCADKYAEFLQTLLNAQSIPTGVQSIVDALPSVAKLESDLTDDERAWVLRIELLDRIAYLSAISTTSSSSSSASNNADPTGRAGVVAGSSSSSSSSSSSNSAQAPVTAAPAPTPTPVAPAPTPVVAPPVQPSSTYLPIQTSNRMNVVLDGVMGGLSQATWSTSTSSGVAVDTFSGTVRTANNGGFASARNYMNQDFSAYEGFYIEVRKTRGSFSSFEIMVDVSGAGQ